MPESLNGKPYEIADLAFTDYDFIKKITIPEGAVTRIACAAFSGCNGLTEVTVPRGIELENSIFSKCENLEKATVYSPLGTFMFENCKNLREVIIADDVAYIDSYAFRGCTALTEITIPFAADYVGNGAFQDCNNLEKVTFANPDGWKRTTDYISYEYRAAKGERFNVDSPMENAKTVLRDGNDWNYFK